MEYGRRCSAVQPSVCLVEVKGSAEVTGSPLPLEAVTQHSA